MISKTIGLFFATAAMTACAAQAASVLVEPLGSDKPTLVLVEGTIVDGDAEQFQAKVNSISTPSKSSATLAASKASVDAEFDRDKIAHMKSGPLTVFSHGECNPAS
jgi:hypothetical protein